MKAAAVNRERTRYGFTFTFGWQKSVGRITRLVCREIARSHGELGALAGKKLEALLTRRTSGQKAKWCAEERFTPKVGASSACGLRLAGSRHDGRRSRALARLALTG